MALNESQSVIYELVQNFVKSEECLAHLSTYVKQDTWVMQAAIGHDWGRLKVNTTYGIIASPDNPKRINDLFGEIETYLTNNISTIFPSNDLSRAGARKLVHYVLMPEALRYGVAMETSNYNLAPNVIRDIVWFGYDHLVRVIAKCKNGEQSVTPAISDPEATANVNDDLVVAVQSETSATDPEAGAHVNDALVVAVNGTADAAPVPVVLPAGINISETPVNVIAGERSSNRRTIKRKFCCLPCQNTAKIPTGEEFVQLSNLGVGLREVSVFADATAKELQDVIYRTYPPLAGHQYVYGKSFRNTLPATLLLDMSSDMAYIQRTNKGAGNIIYIMPLGRNLEFDVVDMNI